MIIIRINSLEVVKSLCQLICSFVLFVVSSKLVVRSCTSLFLENSVFSYKPGSLFYPRNVIDRIGDVVDQGNRFDGIISVTNVGDAESSVSEIAETADMQGNEHISSNISFQSSYVKECHPLYY